MSVVRTDERLRLPETLQTQLNDFRRRVWTVKLIEAACAAAFGVTVAYLAIFVLDRVWETRGWARALRFAGAVLAFASIGFSAYRWVWLNRRPDQLAHLLGRKNPNIGDQLLGIIELV